MITNDKKILMRKIINCFETGSAATDYSSIFIYRDGPNDVRQITLGFGITEYGNMQKLVQVYINEAGRFAEDFQKYVDKIGKSALVNNKDFISLLVKASKEDEVFRKSEDKIFEDKYLTPALAYFNKGGYKETLSAMVFLDSFIHSGSVPSFLISRFPERSPANGGNEKEWIKQYVATRHKWLANHSREILQHTTYRMEFFERLIMKDNWDLNPPFRANDVNISA